MSSPALNHQLPAARQNLLPAGYKWWVVAMLWFICFFNYTDRQAIFSTFPKLEEEFGFDKLQLGLIGSAFMWVYAAGAPLAGFVGDRLKRKHLILGGCLFWSFVTITTGWCARLWQFITVRALEGFGETFYFPASTSLMSDYHGPNTRSRALGIHNSGVYLGTIAGGWLGAWFAATVGWRVGFYVFGSLGMVLALVLYRFLREPLRGAAERASTGPQNPSVPLSVKETGAAIFRTRTARALLAAFMGANFVAMVFLTWTPTFLVEKFHFRLTWAGLTGTVFTNLASAVSVPLGGWLADRWAQRLRGGRMLVQAGGLLVGSAFVFLVGSTNAVAVLLGAMTCFGLCKGLYDASIFASLFDVVDPRARGTAAGIMNTMGWLGGALGPVAVGAFSKYGAGASEMENMSHAIAFCSLIYVASAVVLFVTAFRFAPGDVPSLGQQPAGAPKSQIR